MINDNLRDKEFFDRVVSFYENHIGEETCKEFNITKKQLYKLLNNFGYKKPKEKYIRTKTPSHESYVERGKLSSKKQKLAWENKTDREKELWRESCRLAQLNMSESSKKEKVQKAHDTYLSKSQDEIDSINRKRSESCKKFWSDLSIESREQRLYNQLEKTRETCQDLYDVPYPCMLSSARMSGNNSKPNEEFAQLLADNGIEFTREFRVGLYQYDFKVGNSLIEINPSITHNSTFSPFGRDPISKTYHRDKLKVAEKMVID